MEQELELAARIDAAVKNPEEASARVEKKIGLAGAAKEIAGIITSYLKRDKGISGEQWLAAELAKPEHGLDAAQAEQAAQEIVQGVEGYEAAKRSLEAHIEEGGDRTSWLAEQIEIGAELNGQKPGEYARAIAEGLDGAAEENAAFVFGEIKEGQ